MDEYITLELPELDGSGAINDDDPFLGYMRKRYPKLRDWSFTDPLREGTANLVQSMFGTSNMENERLLSLVGLDDEQFIDAVRDGRVQRDEWALGKMPRTQRDAILKGRIAQRNMWQDNVNQAVDFIKPTHHAQPDTWLGNAGYKTLEAIPGIATVLGEAAVLGVPATVGINTLTGSHSTTEQVYANLRAQGYPVSEARAMALNPFSQLGDLGIKGTTNALTLHALGKPYPGFQSGISPIGHTLRNIGTAMGISGTGAAGNQALTNYRSDKENTLKGLVNIGADAAAATGVMGLIGAGLRAKQLWDAQKLYNESRPINAEWWDITPPDEPPALGGGNNPNNPPNSPLDGTDIITVPENNALPQGTLQLPEFTTRNIAARLNNSVVQRGFNPIANDFQPNALARQIAAYVGNGFMSQEDAINMLQEGGLSPEDAKSFLDTGINEILERTKIPEPPKQPTEIVVPFDELRKDTLFYRPEPKPQTPSKPPVITADKPNTPEILPTTPPVQNANPNNNASITPRVPPVLPTDWKHSGSIGGYSFKEQQLSDEQRLLGNEKGVFHNGSITVRDTNNNPVNVRVQYNRDNVTFDVQPYGDINTPYSEDDTIAWYDIKRNRFVAPANGKHDALIQPVIDAFNQNLDNFFTSNNTEQASQTPRVTALNNEAYYANDYYSDNGGDNSSPEQDIPETHLPDTAPQANERRTLLGIPSDERKTYLLPENERAITSDNGTFHNGSVEITDNNGNKRTVNVTHNPLTNSFSFAFADGNIRRTGHNEGSLGTYYYKDNELVSPYGKHQELDAAFEAFRHNIDTFFSPQQEDTLPQTPKVTAFSFTPNVYLTDKDKADIAEIRKTNPVLADYLESEPSDEELAQYGLKKEDLPAFTQTTAPEPATPQKTQPKADSIAEDLKNIANTPPQPQKQTRLQPVGKPFLDVEDELGRPQQKTNPEAVKIRDNNLKLLDEAENDEERKRLLDTLTFQQLKDFFLIGGLNVNYYPGESKKEYIDAIIAKRNKEINREEREKQRQNERKTKTTQEAVTTPTLKSDTPSNVTLPDLEDSYTGIKKDEKIAMAKRNKKALEAFPDEQTMRQRLGQMHNPILRAMSGLTGSGLKKEDFINTIVDEVIRRKNKPFPDGAKLKSGEFSVPGVNGIWKAEYKNGNSFLIHNDDIPHSSMTYDAKDNYFLSLSRLDEDTTGKVQKYFREHAKDFYNLDGENTQQTHTAQPVKQTKPAEPETQPQDAPKESDNAPVVKFDGTDKKPLWTVTVNGEPYFVRPYDSSVREWMIYPVGYPSHRERMMYDAFLDHAHFSDISIIGNDYVKDQLNKTSNTPAVVEAIRQTLSDFYRKAHGPTKADKEKAKADKNNQENNSPIRVNYQPETKPETKPQENTPPSGGVSSVRVISFDSQPKTQELQKAPEPETPSRNEAVQSDSPVVRLAERVRKYLNEHANSRWSDDLTPFTNKDLHEWAAQEFGGTLGEGAYTQKQAYDAMEMGINLYISEWNIFPGRVKYSDDFMRHIYDLQDVLRTIPTQTNRNEEQVKFQQFSTPPTLAYLVNWLANINKGNTVLEPSAGTGNLAVFAKNAGANLILNDYSESGLRADILDALNWGKVYREDALHLADILIPKLDTLPDRVVMNPPFSAAGKQGTANSNQNGFRHVEQALQLLRNGGRLVAILGAGRDGTASFVKTWLKHIGKKYNVRALITVGGKAYQKFGTTFSNAIVVIDKNGATPKGSTKEFAFSGDFSNDEELYSLFNSLTDIVNDYPDKKTSDYKDLDYATSDYEPDDVIDDEDEEEYDKDDSELDDDGYESPNTVHNLEEWKEAVRRIKQREKNTKNDDEQDTDSTPPKPEPTKPKPAPETPSKGKPEPVTQEATTTDNDIQNSSRLKPVIEKGKEADYVYTPVGDGSFTVDLAWHNGDVKRLGTFRRGRFIEAEPYKETDIDLKRAHKSYLESQTEEAKEIVKKYPQLVEEHFITSYNGIKINEGTLSVPGYGTYNVRYERNVDEIHFSKPNREWHSIKLSLGLHLFGSPDKTPEEKAVAKAFWEHLSEFYEIPDTDTEELGKIRRALEIEENEPNETPNKGNSKPVTQDAQKQDKPTENIPPQVQEPTENETQSKPEKEVAPAPDKVSVSRKSSKQIREERTQQEDNSIQSSYSPTIITKGAKHHPADLVESTVMRSVPLPDIKEKPLIPQSTIDDGRLSDAQMEAVTLAVNSFSHILPNGVRRGFFIGDGTGVGKGREISGIIMDTLSRGAGNGKAVWISDKHSLIKDAIRDWQGLGNDSKDIFPQERFDAKQTIDRKKGILFTAYSHMATKFRIEQLKKWLGENFDGIIVLDEAHNANNVLGGNGKKPATRAINTRDFVKAFPKARVLYVSATGATELDNLAMLDRLGLWGYEDAPFESAQAFVNQVSKGGIAAMEVTARDMKAMGLFVARSLSMRAGPHGGNEDVTFRTLEYTLNDDMVEIYDELVSIWQMIEQNMPAVMKARGYDPKDGKSAGQWKSAFWGAHQRFFNQIITSMQTDSVIRDMRKQLDAGNSVVIQLTNTMEANLNKAIQKGANDDGEYDLSPKDTLIQLITDLFNPRVVEYVTDDEGNEIVQDVVDSHGKPILSHEVIQMRDEMIKIVESINRFPDSPIDKILNFFGHDNVAEITGRAKRPRTVVDKKTGKKSNLETGRTDKVKAGEVEDFNNGKRRILIFSEKGGTGASYHASNDIPNKQKRIHYLLQAGWRADKAIQGLGRSHRSNEAHKPEYVLVTTDIPGQKRFISTIARRLAQLGALSTGERRSTSNGLFSESDNLEAGYVLTALSRFFHNLLAPLDSNYNPYPELAPDDVLKQLGFKQEKLKDVSITDFLNRLLAMSVDLQKKVFARFQQEINTVQEEYQANGIDIDAPTENVKASSINVIQEQRILQSKEFGTDTNYVKLEITRPMNPVTWQDIDTLMKNGVDIEFYTLQSGQIVAAVKSSKKGFDPMTSHFYDQYKLIQPDRRKVEYGVRTEVLDNEDPNQKRKFTRIDVKTAQAIWMTQTDELPETYTSTAHLITGAMLPAWGLIEGHPKIWRVTTDDGREFLGRLIPDKQLQKILNALNVKYEGKKYDADSLKKALDKRGMIATLLNKAKLKFSRVNGEKLLEIIPADEWMARSLKRGSAITMIINGKERFFLPKNNDELLNKTLEQYPLIGEPVQIDDADEILDEAADTINSSLDASDSSHLHIIHPSFSGLFNFGASPAEASDNPYIHESPYASPNTEFEKRYQASKNTEEKKSILGHLKDFALQIVKGRNDIPELAGNNWKNLFAVDDNLIDAQEWLRGFKRERQANLHETEKILRAILLDIKEPNDFDLFQRAMELQDLYETRKGDINASMPWGLNPSLYDFDANDPLDDEYKRIMGFVRKNSRVQDAMRKADTLMEDLRNKLIQAAENIGMFDLRDRLKRKHYFRHLVLEYYNMQRAGNPHPTFKNPERRGYTKHREGSSKDISSNWILAMGEVMIRMTDDIKILQTLGKLRKRYDIIEKLKQQAFSDNMSHAVGEIMKDLKDVPEELRKGKAEEILQKKLNARQSRALSKLFKLASNGDLPIGDNNEWQDLAGRMADAGQLEALSREEQQKLSRYIGWLSTLPDKTKARTQSRKFLTGYKGKNAVLRDILGYKYIDWKDLIPHDHTLWSPSDSRLVFSASTVPEYMLKIAMEGIDDLLGVEVSDLGKAIATGGDKQLWCIPEKLADALDNIGKSQPVGSFGNIMGSMMTAFKRWVTVGPVNGRILKYNYRNFFGDLEAVLQGNPGALYYFKQAAKELTDTMLRGGEATGMLAEFNKRGGGLTTEFMTELEHPERLKDFKHLFEPQKSRNPLKSIADGFRSYIEIASTLTNLRESILRYASFLSFVKLIRENGGVPPFYGMSKPKEVLALKDNIYDMAFKLANENLGAYDQVSRNMQWLRDNNFLSFASWVEVNFSRAVQMYKNIWQGNSFLEYWIKKHGNDFINRLSGGGAGNGNGGGNEPPKNNNSGDFSDDNGDNEFRKMFRRLAKKFGNGALRLAITLALASPLYFMAKIWNRLMGADESDPNLDDRNGVSLYLGRNSFTGDNLYMSDIGSSWDFFRTVGLHSIFAGDLRDLFDGRISFGQLITNILDGPVTKIASNTNPFAKAVAEAAFGKRMYPSALHPSPIRDKGEFVANSFGLDWYYDFLTDKPHKPFYDFSSSLVSSANQDQSAYFFIQSRKRQFQEYVLGKYNDAFTMTRRGEALRNAKRAIDLGDKKSFRKFMREYFKAGGSEAGLKISARASDPLSGLNEDEEKRFIRWLPKEERKILRRAMRYGEKIKAYLEP